MSGLHIETLVKRIGRVGWLPLGAALRVPVVSRRIGPLLYGQIDRFAAVYSASKHEVTHLAGTHLFSLEEALSAYVVSRRLGEQLYPHASLATDMTLFTDSASPHEAQ